MTAWHKTQYPGVRYREHPSRKFQGKLDRYFAIRYKIKGVLKEEALGWSSEGWNAQKAHLERSGLRKAQTLGEGPQTLGEKRELAQEAKKAEIERKERLSKDQLTFRQYFMDTYFPGAKSNKKEWSWKREQSLLKLWIDPVVGKLPLKDIRPLHLERIKKNMTDAKKSPRSIHYALAVIRQVFNSARKNRLFQGISPVTGVSKPKIDNGRQRFLTRAEADSLLDHLASSSPQLYDMSLLSLHCGLRAGEIFNLTWGCVDFTNGTLLLMDTKSGRNRTVFMTSKVKEMLEKKPDRSPEALVFKSRDGKKFKEISGAFRGVIKELGLNKDITDPRMKVTFHSLRHSYASWLVQNGEDLYTVKKLLGHSTITMTERYSHLGSNTLRKAVERLDSSLKEAPKNKVVNMGTAALAVTTA
jgi:integrase